MRKTAAIFRQGLARAGLSGEQVRSRQVGEHLISWSYFEVGSFCGLTKRWSQQPLPVQIDHDRKFEYHHSS